MTQESPSTPSSLDPATAFVVQQPKMTAYILLGIAFLLLGIAGWNGNKLRSTAKPSGDTAETKLDTSTSEDELRKPERLAYTLSALLGAITLGATGIWLFSSAPPTDLRIAEARRVILAAAGGGGILLMFLGFTLFYMWFESFSKWLTEGSEGVKAFTPLFTMLVGGGLALLAVQPARAEERSDATLRRLIYGSNIVLTSLMLLGGLIVANVFAGYRVPNRLDTTSSGFYTLDKKTNDYLAQLPNVVNVYAALTPPDGSDPDFLADTRRLLQNAQEVNPAKFRVKFLSPTLDKSEFSRLKAKYPQADIGGLGVLLTTGENEERSRFIRAQDLETEEGGGMDQFGRGPRGKIVYQGENLLVRELLALSETGAKPVVYFTQSFGELEILPSNRPQLAGKGRPANQIRSVLEKAYYDVKPWNPTPDNSKVPDDAAVLVIADPTRPVTREISTAIKDYLNAKKGKVIAIVGVHPQPNSNAVNETGLDEVFAEFQIRVGNQLLLGLYDEAAEFEKIITGVTSTGDNPVSKQFPLGRGFEMANCRLVQSMPPQPEGQQPPNKRSSEPLFFSSPGAISWLEAEIPADTRAVFDALRRNKEVQRQKRVSEQPRELAAVGYEDKLPRLVVIGSGDYFVDGRERPGRVSPAAEMFVNLVDWVRERPKVTEVANKVRGEFSPSKPSGGFQLYVLPLLIASVLILGVGLGVWVVRRT